MLEGEFILQRQNSSLMLSCHGLSHFQNGFVLPQILEVPPAHSGAGQEGRARGRSCSWQLWGTCPPPSPAWEMRRSTGQGLEAGGAHGLDTAQRGQEHSTLRNSTARTRGGRGRMKVDLKKGSGQSHRLSHWEAAFHGWILNHCWILSHCLQTSMSASEDMCDLHTFVRERHLFEKESILFTWKWPIFQVYKVFHTRI